MKIFKYVVIILVLLAVFLSVYIATGKSTFELNVSKQTELSEQRLFRYVNNLQNFKEWNPWNNNESAFKLDSVSQGTGAKVYWTGDSALIDNVLPNDMIHLKMHIDGGDYDTKMSFSKKDGKTTLNWNVTGNLSFKEKVQLFFKGTPETLIAPTFEKGLNAIVHHISESLGNKIFQSIEHMNNFARNFELEPYGSPFTIFETINLQSGSVKYAVCLPIRNFFSTAEGSDVICEQIDAFHGYKVVLNGDYIHSDKAWKEAKKEVALKHLTERTDLKPIAIYKNSILNTQKPEEWVTEFIIPVNESFIPIVEEETKTVETE